jgi:hypothetical protein
MKTVQKLLSALAFWQQVAMVTLAYGAVMFWIALTFKDQLGFANIFTLLTAQELGLLVVSSGTVGLHLFRSRWEKQGRWTDAKWFAIGTQGVLLIITLAAGLNPFLGGYFAVIAMGHVVLTQLKQQPAASAE